MINFEDSYRNSETARAIVEALKKYCGRKLKIMEICGTHTMAVFRYGIRDILPENISLISGPGCPVCVTPVSYIDSAVELAGNSDVILTTFGDLMRVPGSSCSLIEAKAQGADIRIVYSPLDSLLIAKENSNKKVVFLSVGFETTTPISALTIVKAYNDKLPNFSMLTANKTMPEALKILLQDAENKIDGYLYPGHVTAITGTALYEEIAEKFLVPGVVAGFEPLDILHAILSISRMAEKKEISVLNEYSRVVRIEGNELALGKMYEVFEPYDSNWRGLGIIKGSGLAIRQKYETFDAVKVFGLHEKQGIEPPGCLCGEVLKGRVTPLQCRLFGKVCTPEAPAGACMVSTEGTCAAFYRYGREK